MQTKFSVKKAPLRRLIMMVVVLGAAIALSACGSNEAKKGTEGKLNIVATIGMIGDVAEQVGGDHVTVTSLMGPGVDPHLYKASQGDMKKLDGADIVFYNGLHLEGKMVDILEKMSSHKTTVAVSKTIPEAELLSDPVAPDSHDPHIWFNVQNWMKATEVIRDTLIEADSAHAEDYRKNAEAFLTQLKETDDYAREQIGQIPEEHRILVTAHDAFHYFGRAYNIQVMGLQGISTASEYGSKDVSDLRDYLVEHHIKAVFVESSVSTKAIEAVIEGAKKMGHTVEIGGELFSDAMGKAGTTEGTYIGMVRHNVDIIVKALK
ncbi:metal ABC transporter solute-binding protein, Zn/Mn family [Paenibacillus terrigena]|uniref:metal ABC transporter solute-binding protein, Zn/Mn family n=1 Tax=Paenibacillus terrigena TaxID=369333 RepID=UPI00036A058F|nr:zinc ABC transporter substrate-binding protein [Paenibacillus terrigena]